MQNRKLKIIIALAILTLLASCNFKKKSQNTKTITYSYQELSIDHKGLSHKRAIIRTIHGNIEFKFYPKLAPVTVTRVIRLIREDFYNGLQFFKVLPDFVIQTGDPTNSGKGGSGKKLIGEFSSIQHVKGTVAMARGKNRDSADSQFYIALTTLPHLDKKYTIFGQVITGLNVLDKITKGDKILSITIKN